MFEFFFLFGKEFLYILIDVKIIFFHDVAKIIMSEIIFPLSQFFKGFKN